MCMIDDSEPLTLLVDAQPLARKSHRCGECGRVIEPTERYERHEGVCDGEWETHKTCLHCVAVRKWLSRVCRGWVYTMVDEDLLEHFREGYGLWLGRAYVGMRRKWRRRDGKLMAPMELPERLPEG